MRTYLLLVSLLLLPTVTQAQTSDRLKLPTMIYAASGVADWSSTAYCVSDPRCGEQNPMFGWARKPLGTGGMVAIGLAVDATFSYEVHRWGQHHPRTAKIILYAGAGFRLFLAARNTYYARLVREQPLPCRALFCQN